MASIHLHSSGRSPYYQAKFRDAQGLIRVKSTKQTSPKEALKVAFAYEDSAAAARNGMLTEAQARRVISQAYEIAAKQPLRFCSTRDYLTNWVKANYATKSKGTAERYERVVLDFLEFIGARAGVDLRHIAPKDVEGFRNNEYRLGKSASSVNLALKALNIPFNLARRQVLIEVNPVEAVELLPKDGEERIPFTTQQLHTILKTADTEWKGMVLLGYYTGARLEVCAKMKWGTVDFETPLIRFTPNKVRRGKKAKEIVCPMHAELAEYLRSLPGPKHPNSFILPHLSSR